jgi:hypothetical protein
MTDPRKDEKARSPANQTDESAGGAIKSPQQTDATMAEKDLARGSEPEAHARRG